MHLEFLGEDIQDAVAKKQAVYEAMFRKQGPQLSFNSGLLKLANVYLGMLQRVLKDPQLATTSQLEDFRENYLAAYNAWARLQNTEWQEPMPESVTQRLEEIDTAIGVLEGQVAEFLKDPVTVRRIETAEEKRAFHIMRDRAIAEGNLDSPLVDPDLKARIIKSAYEGELSEPIAKTIADKYTPGGSESGIPGWAIAAGVAAAALLFM